MEKIIASVLKGGKINLLCCASNRTVWQKLMQLKVCYNLKMAKLVFSADELMMDWHYVKFNHSKISVKWWTTPGFSAMTNDGPGGGGSKSWYSMIPEISCSPVPLIFKPLFPCSPEKKIAAVPLFPKAPGRASLIAGVSTFFIVSRNCMGYGTQFSPRVPDPPSSHRVELGLL